MNKLSYLLDQKKRTFARALKENKRYDEVRLRVLEMEQEEKHRIEMCKALSFVKKLMEAQRIAYSESVLESIREGIQSAVNWVLEGKEYRVALNSQLYRGKKVLKLYLVDEQGRELPPKIVEGDMLNQVLSFSAVVVLTLRGKLNWVYYDEAFASANPYSMKMIKTLIKQYSALGCNFVFVTQNPILLSGSKKHVVELVSNGTEVSHIIETDHDPYPNSDERENEVIELLEQINKEGVV